MDLKDRSVHRVHKVRREQLEIKAQLVHRVHRVHREFKVLKEFRDQPVIEEQQALLVQQPPLLH